MEILATDRAEGRRRLARRVALGWLLAVAAAAGPAAAQERWYLVRIGGTAVGTIHETVTVAADGSAVSASAMEMTLERLGEPVRISMAGTSVEDAAGALRSVAATMRLSERAMVVEGRVEGDRLRLTSRVEGGAPAGPPVELPTGGAVLGPEGWRRAAAALESVGQRVEGRLFSPELGSVLALARELEARETVAVGGREVAARRVRETSADPPVRRTLWLAADGELLRLTEAGPFGEVAIERVDEAAVAAFVPGGLPADLYQRTLAPSSLRLPSARSVDRVRLRLRPRDPGRGMPNLAGESQRVLETSREGVVLEVVRPRPPAGPAPLLPAAELPPGMAPYLASGALVTAGDPEVARLAREIVGGERDAYRAALRLTEWVARHFEVDYGIAFAPAAELARDRRGTCAGAATLLAALARAAGIPARLAMGFVYLQGVWGGHAWSELWIDGRWLPFDAALYAPGVADAARFAFLRDAFAAGPGTAGLLAGAQLYGNLDVEVLEVEQAGRSLAAAGLPPYRLAGDRYENPGLGFALAGPEGARLARWDRRWPDPTLVAVEAGPAAVTVRELDLAPAGSAAQGVAEGLRQLGLDGPVEAATAAGRPAFRAAGVERAAVAWVDGTSAIVAVAEGPGAAELLARTLAGWSWPARAAAR